MSIKTIAQVESLVTEKLIPGANLAIFEEGQWQFASFGRLGVVAPYVDEWLNGSESYDLASLTKVVGTTTSILQLVDNGRLNLTDKVNQLVPELPEVAASIEELLLHRSGLPGDFPKDRVFNEANLLKYLNELLLAEEDKVVYSDLGYLILGLIIEKITGENLGAYEQANIFKPIGMNQTSYQPSGTSRFVPTEITESRGLVVGQVHDSKAFNFGRPAGSAGLFSTSHDLSLFCDALLTNQVAGKNLFSAELYQKLLHINQQQRTLGWEKPFTDDVLYHTGFTGTALGWSAEQQKALILLTNRIHPNRQDNGFLQRRLEIYQNFFEV